MFSKKNFITLLTLISATCTAAPECDGLFSKIGKESATSQSVNLKKAQEVAEDFVNRKTASEVLTDPGVEAALVEATAFPNPRNVRDIQEALEEALLARGMSEGQAKKAAKGWSDAMKKAGVFGEESAPAKDKISSSSAQVNLKRAQELAEEFVNRKVASEVLTDPGVEAALEYTATADKNGALPMNSKTEKFEMVSEAIEEALLARGMSPGQAKKAAEGWTKVMQSEGIFQ